MLVTLLARETPLRVAQVVDGMRPEPNVIYVTPARSNVVYEKGLLHLSAATRPATPKPSIDDFFVSLAGELGEHAVGIVLSGTGSDGARGIRAIRAAGGITFAQDHATAKYSGMPTAAFETGCVDYVLPPDQIAERLGKLDETAPADHVPLFPPEADSTFDRICTLVRTRAGLDLHLYKESTVQRRIRRRMVATECATLESYERTLKARPNEVERLANELLISVTSFFRDPDAFAAMGVAIDGLLARKRPQDPLRVWVPGCATGEEAYSIAILVAEAMAKSGHLHRIQIFATDLDARALARARRGIYSAQDLAPLPDALLLKYFVESGERYQVAKSLREMLVFSTHNLTEDPPFLKLDLISCRNVLIYLRPQVQGRVLEMLNVALVSGGLLFLGKSEAVYQHEHLFKPVDDKARIYVRVDGAVTTPRTTAEFTPRERRLAQASAPAERQTIGERVLAAIQDVLLPPAVVVDERLELKHVFGDVSPFVRVGAGEAQLNLNALAAKDLRIDIRSMVMKVQRNPSAPVIHTVHPRSHPRPIRLAVLGLPAEISQTPLFLVAFQSLAREKPETGPQPSALEDRDAQIVALEEQLVATREHLQTVIEELETSNEELQSLNEELQSANEELQSANEELETTNEELQSTNEELSTVNEELETKTHELIALNNDLENVKDSLAYGLVVVDAALRVVLFNRPALQIFALSASSIGEQLFSLPCELELGLTRPDILGVIEGGPSIERQLGSDRHYLLSVRPYLDDQRRRRGAVLTFVDNTELRRAEQRLLETNARLQASERFNKSTIDALPDHICVVAEDGRILAVNEAWTAFMRRNDGALVGCGPGANYVDECRRAATDGDPGGNEFLEGLKSVLEGRADRFSLEYPCHAPEEERWFRVTVAPFSGDGPRLAVVSHEDITARKQGERLLRLQGRALDAIADGLAIADARDRSYPLVYVNKAFERITGYAAAEVLGENCRFLQGDDRDQPGLDEIRAALAAFRPARTLLRNYRKDHTLFWNELSIFPVTDDRGAPAYFVGVQRDMTAAISAEQALSASRDREKLALSFSNVGTFEWDVRSGRITGSELFMRLHGIDEARGAMDQTALRRTILEEDRPAFEDALKLCLAGHDDLDVEYRVRWPDGTIHWLHTKGDAESSSGGIPVRLLCLSQDITERREADERVRYIAHHDALTGLPNRALLRDRLQQAINAARRNRTRIAVLFIDLDHFKAVNDSLGHQVGDQLLQSVATRLKACTRDSDTLCRQSGDEYIVVLPDIRDSNEAAHVAAKILEALSQPHQIEGHELRVTPSIGISIYPDDGDTLDVLVRHADAAMYHAKGSGRGNYQFSLPALNQLASRKLEITSQLRQAIVHGELELHYQPQIDVTTGGIVGLEALVRWRHPERGLVLPDTFIPVAEDSELILDLGEWVLDQACRQASLWRAAGLAQIPIAVNFSALQFRQKNVIEKISRALHESGLPPQCLEVELTERVLMSSSAEAEETVRDLHRLGIRVAVDDFGTGYSNLSYLMRFPIDKLKIDRSFLRSIPGDRGATAIVRAVINLGLSLDLDVVAEGVEAEHQLEFLRSERCQAFQGFLAHPALPAEQLGTLLGRH
jgi:two-component system CheB/CheR fusion protein